MRVLVVGASGAIGTRLISQLTDRGHEVTGSSRSAGKAGRLRALGAEPIVLDVLDARAVRAAVAARPEAIIYEATALADAGFSRKLDRTFAQTNRLRTEGTDILLAAAREAGVRRFVAQSFAPYRYARVGGPVKTHVHRRAALAVPPQLGSVEPYRIGRLMTAGSAVRLDIRHRMGAIHPHHRPGLPPHIPRAAGVAGRMPLAHPDAVADSETGLANVGTGVNDGQREHRAAQREPPARTRLKL